MKKSLRTTHHSKPPLLFLQHPSLLTCHQRGWGSVGWWLELLSLSHSICLFLDFSFSFSLLFSLPLLLLPPGSLTPSNFIKRLLPYDFGRTVMSKSGESRQTRLIPDPKRKSFQLFTIEYDVKRSVCHASLEWLPIPGSSGIESTCNVRDLGLIPRLARSPGEGNGYPLQYSWASLVAWLVRNLPEMQETWVWPLGWEDPLEKGKLTHSNILAWRIPWTV